MWEDFTTIVDRWKSRWKTGWGTEKISNQYLNKRKKNVLDTSSRVEDIFGDIICKRILVKISKLGLNFLERKQCEYTHKINFNLFKPGLNFNYPAKSGILQSPSCVCLSVCLFVC